MYNIVYSYICSVKCSAGILPYDAHPFDKFSYLLLLSLLLLVCLILLKSENNNHHKTQYTAFTEYQSFMGRKGPEVYRKNPTQYILQTDYLNSGHI